MDRLLQGVGATLSATFESAGVPTNPSPDTATVVITRADGTTLASGSAYDDGTGKFSYDLTPEQTEDLDSLTATWTADFSGQADSVRTYAEIVGGFYFSISEAKALPELADKTAEEIAHVRTRAEQAFEDAARVAFVPRYHRATLSAIPGYEIPLPKYPVRGIRDVTEVTGIGGTPTAVDASGFTFTRQGVYRASGWIPGPNNVTVGYEYGYDRPPERVAQAVLLLAKNWLVVGPIDDRATAIPAGEAGGVITLATPGVRDDVFGIPEVDAALKQYGRGRSGIYSVPLSPPSNSYYRLTAGYW